jgi:D-alanyl-lipoteichoic acid acyltransferase DltB (MBOAT superfamily)
MLFNSVAFFLFLAVTVLGYFCLPKRFTVYWLVAASIFFYSFWNIYNLPLLLIIIAVNHYAALFVGNCASQVAARTCLIAVAVFDVGILAFFKYLDFGLTVMADVLGFTPPVHVGEIKRDWLGALGLPLGISFFTFEVLSYVIDCYRRTVAPEPRLSKTSLFVTFFPHLIAGPIVRAAQLFPQISGRNPFDLSNFNTGFLLISLGLFKKVVVADNLAIVSDSFFSSPSGGVLDAWIGVVCFTFQIYADFSGYIDIALGAARLFGIELPPNFNRPYYKTNIQEFWRSWNMTLSQWFRDYFYIPLGGSRRGELRTYGNLMLTMIVIGLWHGASYTFLLWGAYHGVLLIIHRLMRDRLRLNLHLPAVIKTFCLFVLVAIGWVFFRATDVQSAIGILQQCFFGGWSVRPETNVGVLVLIPLMMIFEGATGERIRTFFPSNVPRHVAAVMMLLMVLLFNSGQSNQFIYFVF